MEIISATKISLFSLKSIRYLFFLIRTNQIQQKGAEQFNFPKVIQLLLLEIWTSLFQSFFRKRKKAPLFLLKRDFQPIETDARTFTCVLHQWCVLVPARTVHFIDSRLDLRFAWRSIRARVNAHCLDRAKAFTVIVDQFFLFFLFSFISRTTSESNKLRDNALIFNLFDSYQETNELFTRINIHKKLHSIV